MSSWQMTHNRSASSTCSTPPCCQRAAFGQTSSTAGRRALLADLPGSNSAQPDDGDVDEVGDDDVGDEDDKDDGEDDNDDMITIIVGTA